jgi:hypothetical protein
MVTAIERKHIYDWFYKECERLGIDPQTLDIDAEADWSLSYREIIDQLANKWAGYGFTAPWAPEVVEIVKVKPERVRRLEEELKKLREEKKRWTELKDWERLRLLERIKELGGKIEEAKAGKPEAPPAPKPEPKFKVGEKAFHPVEKEVTVLAQTWNEPVREWMYVVEGRRRRKEQFFEHELIKLPELPPAPPRAPRVPRAPPAPPKPVEELVREFPRPLTRVDVIPVFRTEVVEEPKTWPEMTEFERRQKEAGLTPMKSRTVERVESVRIPVGLFIYYDTELAKKVAEETASEISKLARDEPIFRLPQPVREEIERLKAKMFEKLQFYEVDVDKQRVVPVSYARVLEHVRRVMRPVRPPTPRGVLPFRPVWPFRGPPTLPGEELRKGMSDEEVKEVFGKRGITLSDEGVKFMRERYGI